MKKNQSTMKPSRRHVMAGAAAMVASAPGLVAQAGEPEDPILPLYREWVAARIEWYRYCDLPGNGDWNMPESKAAEAREDAAFWTMIEMTPTSMGGLAALAHVLWDLEGPSWRVDTEEFVEECETPTCKLMLSIWRCASGRKGLPPTKRMEELS